MAAMRDDSEVAWVERDGIVSIRDGAPHAMSTNFLRTLLRPRAVDTAGRGRHEVPDRS